MAKKSPFYFAVQRALNERKMNQNDLAELLQISPQYVSLILYNRTGDRARQEYILKIAKILSIDFSELPDDIKHLIKPSELLKHIGNKA